jgi:hemin uptake protein HemP
MVDPRSESSNSREVTETLPSLASMHSASPKIVRFTDLSRCGDEIWIELDGQIYRLRKTRQGKLILTK